MTDPIIGTWMGVAHKNKETDTRILKASPKTYGVYVFNPDGTGGWTSKSLFRTSTTPFLWNRWDDECYDIDYLGGKHWHDVVYSPEQDLLMLRLCFGPTAGMIRFLKRV